MHQDTIIFQLATHYLPKISLRLECLCQTVNQASEETHPVIHHSALKNILEIIQLIEKPELKSRFLKELMRIEHLLNKQHIVVSDELLQTLHNQIHTLTHVVGRFGEGIHQDPFLQSIGITQSANNKDCEMYSPQLLLWLESHPSMRQGHLLLWLSTLTTLNNTVNLYLSLLRATAEFKKIEMSNGFYQRPLSATNSCHLILLKIEKSFGIVPRMQLGHHGLSLQLCDVITMREVRDTQAKPDLAICQL